MYNKVFIVGPPRSGSHFLYKAFRINPIVVANTKESSVFRDIVGYLKNARFFWRRNLNSLAKQYDDFKGLKAFGIDKATFLKFIKEAKELSNDKEEQAKILIEKILDSYYHNNKTNRSQLLVEKTPVHIFFVNEILNYFPEAKVICLARNPEDSIKSLAKLAKKDTYWVPKELDGQIKVWTESVNEVLKLREAKEHEGRIHEVSYEDLMNGNIEEVLTKAFKFADCDLDQNEFSKLINKLPIRPNNEKSTAFFTETELSKIKKQTDSLKKRLGY